MWAHIALHAEEYRASLEGAQRALADFQKWMVELDRALLAALPWWRRWPETARRFIFARWCDFPVSRHLSRNQDRGLRMNGDDVSPKHEMQTNKLLGAATMALHGYPTGDPAMMDPPVPFDIHPRSQNHIEEGSSVALRRYHPGHPKAKAALDQFVQRKTDQRDHGHMGSSGGGSELGTDGHCPIWYRSEASGLLTLHEYVEQGHSEYTQALGLQLDWWRREKWIATRHRVKRGQHAGEIWMGADRLDRDGHNDVRDIAWQIIDSFFPQRVLGMKTQSNAQRWPDIFCYTLLLQLREHKVLGPELLAMTPVAAHGLTITRFTNGHVSKVGTSTVWVDYATGETGVGEPPGGLSRFGVSASIDNLPAVA